jgi:hypothetical protein
MMIASKFATKCTACHGPVKIGERVEWTRGVTGVAHERCLSAEKPTINRPKSFAPTAEQGNVLDLFATGQNLAVEAGAGTGKTSTLILLAESAPKRKGQYIAFNASIVKEAKSKFPSSVKCNTAHSLAYAAVGHRYQARLNGSRRVRSLEIANRLRMEPISVTVKVGEGDSKPRTLGLAFLGGLVMGTVSRFCSSADRKFSTRHVPRIDAIDAAGEYENQNRIAAEVLPYAERAWADLQSTTGGMLPFRHEHYLKIWQLSNPFVPADYILFDECQDANPVMLAIVDEQSHAQRIYVGDSQQQIYGFTGAVNALDRIREQGATTAYLTQSFRFGPAIAEVANTILSKIPTAVLRLVGTDAVQSVVGPVAEPDAILSRTNAAAVHSVISYQAQGKKAHLIGGGTDILSFTEAAADLQVGRRTEHPDLACFDTWQEVCDYVAQDEQGGDLRLNVKLVNEFTTKTILAALRNMVTEKDSDVVVSTAHKAKGREWQSVRLASDFLPVCKMSVDELRLLYVAATRAKTDLDVTMIDFRDKDPNARMSA